MAADDRILKILFQLQADLTGGSQVKGALGDIKNSLLEIQKIGAYGNYLDGLKKSTTEAKAATFSLGDAFKFAGAEEALRRVLDVIKEVPRRIEDWIDKGVEFNAEMQNIQTGIAAVLQLTQGGKFVDFESAKVAAVEFTDVVKDKANELGIAYRDMFEGVQHTQAQLANAGITDINKIIDLTVVLNRAMQSVGVTSNQAARDIGDILQGQAARTLGGARLASALGMTKEEMDTWILGLIQTGQLYDGLTTKMAPLAAASRSAASNFTADVNRMKNAILDLEGEAAKPLMQPLQEALEQLAKAGISTELKAGAREFGGAIVSIAQGLKEGTVELSHFIDKYRELLALVPGAGAAVDIGKTVAGSFTAGYSSALLETQTEELRKQVDLVRQRAVAAESEGQKAVAFLDLVSLQAQIEQQINDEKAKGAQADQGILSALNGALDVARNLREAFSQIAGSAAQAANAVHAITPELQKLLDTQALFRAETYGDDAEVYRAKWVQTYHSIAEEGRKAGQQLSQGELEQLTYERLEGPERQRKIADLQKESGLQRDILEYTRANALLLEGIRGRQQVIQQNPFLSVDQKDAQLAQSITQEIAAMNQQIDVGKAKLAGSALDPATYTQVAQKVQQDTFALELLRLKLASIGTFSGKLRTDFISWANSFGTAAHQVSGIITGTLNTAIGSTSQALTALIFKTGNWKQAMASAAQSIVQNIIQIALQFVVSRTLMSLINAIFGKADAQAANSEAGAAFAAWEPAAIAADTASYGAASAAALISFAAAVAAGQAIGAVGAVGGAASVGAGFESGGFTGVGSRSDVAGIVHRGEFVFSKPAVEAIGLARLEVAHHSALSSPSFESGGFVGGSGTGWRGGPAAFHPDDLKIEVYNFTDHRELMNKWAESSAGRKILNVHGRKQRWG
jgi:hypothetical protein